MSGQTRTGRSGSDNRRFVEAVLWIARTGSLARSSLFFGNWNSVFKRYRDWVKAGVSSDCSRLLRRAGYGIRHGRCHHRQSHRHGQGAKGGRRTRRSALQGRHDDKILALTDALGNLVRFVCCRPPFRYGRRRSADRRNRLRRIDRRQGLRQQCHHCQPQRARRKDRDLSAPRRALPLRLDTELYKWRHLIENFFCKLKEFKRIAMRADKTNQSFAAIIHLVAAVINSRSRIKNKF